MSKRVEFVKGHCGWDVVTLLPEGQVPPDQELSCAMQIMNPPIDGGLEVGWMGHGRQADEIVLRMVSSTEKGWIAMCGGMTQVIGKALIETFLRDRFAIDTTRSQIAIRLLTPSGEIPIEIRSQRGKAIGVTTTMDSFVSQLYQGGVEPLMLRGVPVLRLGDYIVIDMTALEERYPEVDFALRTPGRHLDIVNSVLRDFRRLRKLNGVVGMLFDERPEGPGQIRVFPRFYSDDLVAARIPWEFQCGTGSVAVAMALAHERKLGWATNHGQLLLEWGSNRATKDPYGIRTSLLKVELEKSLISRASFEHSTIEVIAEGKLTLPSF